MSYIEVGAIDRYVVATWGTRIDRWLADGYVPWERYRSLYGIRDVLPYCSREQIAMLWRELFQQTALPPHAITCEIADQLEDLLRCRLPKLILLARLVPRADTTPYAPPAPPKPQGPPRLNTEHYVVVEVVDKKGNPAHGVRLELVIAGGEVRSASTGSDGLARVERIQAGRVVIRVLGIDGSMWEALDGEPAQLSSQEAGVRWHLVRQGECLSKIAHHHGLKDWQALWEHPKNQPLRKKRKNPHVLLPGDEVAVPGINVYEMVRATDATHRLLIGEALVEFRVIVQDQNQQPFRNEAYELRLSAEPNEKPRTGTTDGDGQVIERLKPRIQQVTVTLPRYQLTWSFALSRLVPVPEKNESHSDDGKPTEHAIKATQTRLNALGFPCGAVDGRTGSQTSAALALFQRAEHEERGALADEPDAGVDDQVLAQLDTMFEVHA